MPLSDNIQRNGFFYFLFLLGQTDALFWILHNEAATCKQIYLPINMLILEHFSPLPYFVRSNALVGPLIRKRPRFPKVRLILDLNRMTPHMLMHPSQPVSPP